MLCYRNQDGVLFNHIADVLILKTSAGMGCEFLAARVEHGVGVEYLSCIIRSFEPIVLYNRHAAKLEMALEILIMD